MGLMSSASDAGVTAFNSLNMGLKGVENIMSAFEKGTRTLDIMAATHLESVQSELEATKKLAAQKQQLLNIKIEKDLKREMELLGVSL